MRVGFGADKTRKLVQNPFKRMGRFLQEVFTNLNMTFEVEKCYHNGKNYIYLYECLPKKSWAVVVYDNDDDTMVSSEYFTDWKMALTEYNKKKKN